MPKKYKIDSSYFDEIKFAEKILTLSFDISTTMNRLIQNETCSVYYSLLVKYLVHKETNLDDIKKILRRHITLCLYKILSNKRDKNKVVKVDTMEMLLKNITISKLLEDEIKHSYSSFYYLYTAETFEEINEAYLSFLDEYGSDDWIKLLFKIIFDYFYFNCLFADLKYINHNDLMISHSLFDDHNMNSFTFKVLEDFTSNWKCTEGSSDDYKEVVLGHVINIIFENNNLDFNNTMNIKALHYYKMMINEARKKNIQGTLYFMEVDFENRTAIINKKEIKQEFDFKYNNVIYRFTKNGIVEK